MTRFAIHAVAENGRFRMWQYWQCEHDGVRAVEFMEHGYADSNSNL